MVTKRKSQHIVFKMVSDEDYATPLTGLTISSRISKDGAAFVLAENSAQEIGFGWYKLLLTESETNADELILMSSASGAAQSDRLIIPTASIEDIMGPLYDIEKHSLSTRPLGGSGGGGSCAWFDDDIAAVRKFISYSGKSSKKVQDSLQQLNKSLNDNETLELARSIISNDKSATATLCNIEKALDSLGKRIDTTETILINMADPEVLQEVLEK